MAEELKSSEDGKLSVGISLKLTLVGQRIYAQSGIQFSRRFKDECEDSIEIPDPKQPKLPLS